MASSENGLKGDIRQSYAHLPMRPRQIAAIAFCVLPNAQDGFDVLSISFAFPAIAKEWGIERGALGVVLSMELVGMIMAGGSLFGAFALLMLPKRTAEGS